MKPKAAEQLYSEAGNWMYRARRRLVEGILQRWGPEGGEVLEVGAGAGYFLPVFKEIGAVDVVEVNADARDLLRRNYHFIRSLFETGIPDLSLDRKYDVVAACDVVEHIRDDRAALAWMSEHLRQGGLLVVTVPAYQWLYGDHDRANEHFRRYNLTSLLSAMPVGMELLHGSYFNMFLFPLAVCARMVWMGRNRIRARGGEMSNLKQSSDLPRVADALFYRLLAGEAAAIRRGISLPVGLTLVTVLRKV